MLKVKWRRFKIFLTGDDPGPRNRSWRRLWAPLVYNVEQDPREEVDIAIANLWIFEPVMRQVYPFLFSVESEGLILPGGDEPEDATVEIPFQSQDEIEKSMSGAVELEWTHALLLSSAADSAPDAVDVGRVGCTARLGVEDSLRQLGPALRHRLLAARGEKVEQVDGERLGRASFVPVESRAPSGARTTGSPQRSLPGAASASQGNQVVKKGVMTSRPGREA